MSDNRWPSLPPPAYNARATKCASLLNCKVLEAKELEYKQWLADLHKCPYPIPVGVRPTDLDEMGMDLEDDDESAESEGEEEIFDGSIVIPINQVGMDSDVDHMDESSAQDNNEVIDAFNDT